MALRKQKPPDLLNDLPNGEKTEAKVASRKLSSPKAKPVIAQSTSTSNSSQPTRTGSFKSPLVPASPLLTRKLKKPVIAATPDEDMEEQSADTAAKPAVELTFKELLQISMEENALKVFDLDLRQKQIHCIPFALKEFKRLRILDLSSNQISEIQNLMDNKELKELKLYDNLIDSICLLDSLKELSSLQLQYNRITKIGTGLSPLKKLTSLRLNNNKLTALEVKELAPLSQLVYLDISFNKINDITAIVSLPNLEELLADSNHLETLPDFSRCKKLRDLRVSYNRLTSIATIRSAPLLEELDASHNQIGEFPGGAGPLLERLTSLNLSDNRLADFRWLATACPAIYTLDMSNNNGPTELDEQLTGVLSRLENLFELTFANCETPVAAVQRLLPGLDFFNGFSLNRPNTAGQSRGGPPPPMRPMSAASVVTARQVENQLRNLESRTDSMEEQTEQAFQHLRSRLGQQLASTLAATWPEASASPSSGNRDPDEPPLTGRSSRHSRLRDALDFGRQSSAM